MDLTSAIALSGNSLTRERLTLTANNLANISTPGFEADEMVAGSHTAEGAGVTKSKSVSFATFIGSKRSLEAGADILTGDPYHFRCNAGHYFQVETAEGLRFTRDGSFLIDPATRQLATQNGAPVMSDGGAGIVIPPGLEGAPFVAADGTLSVGEKIIGRLGIFTFEDPQKLEKIGKNLLKAPAGIEPQVAKNPGVMSGKLNGSNVNPILEIADLISISRSDQMGHKIIRTMDELNAQAAQDLLVKPEG